MRRAHPRFRLSLALGAAALVVASCGSSEVAATTTSPDPTTTLVRDSTTTTMSGAEALAIVEAAFAAYNAGDMTTWFLWREGGGDDPAAGDYFNAVESRYTVDSCTERGFGVWLMDDPVTGYGFDCEVTQTDLLLAAAGIELEMTYNWVIGPDGPSSSLGGSNEDFELVDSFLGEFRAWLFEAHPELRETIRYRFDSNLLDPESVPTALEYIDEFVAQSDTYPLAEPVPPGNYGGPLTEASNP